MRGVGHEAPLAGEQRLGLVAGRVELSEHAVEGACEFGDLVVGERLGHVPGGITGAGDLRRGGCEDRDGRHRAARDRHARHQRQHAAGQHPDEQEQLDALDRRLRRRDGAGVLHDHLAFRQARGGVPHDRRLADHAISVHGFDADTARDGGSQRRCVPGLLFDHLAVQREHLHDRVVGREVFEWRDDPQRVDRDPHLVGKLFRGVEDLAVEVRADAVDGE